MPNINARSQCLKKLQCKSLLHHTMLFKQQPQHHQPCNHGGLCEAHWITEMYRQLCQSLFCSWHILLSESRQPCAHNMSMEHTHRSSMDLYKLLADAMNATGMYLQLIVIVHFQHHMFHRHHIANLCVVDSMVVWCWNCVWQCWGFPRRLEMRRTISITERESIQENPG